MIHLYILWYKRLFNNFNSIKSYFIDKGVAIIINEVGAFTEENKEI